MECTLIDPGTSDQPTISTPKFRKSTRVDDEQYIAEKRRLKIDRKKLKLEKQKLKLVNMKENNELKKKLMKAKISYYQSITETE